MRMRLLPSILGVFMTALVLGCAGVSDLSAEAVGKLSAVELCRLNERTPVGFIPLEVQRRKLDCRTQHRAMLDHVVKSDSGVLYNPPEIPVGALSQSACNGVRLGRVLVPYVTETRTANTVSGTSDSRFHQHVVNDTDATVYALFDLTFKDRSGPTGKKLVVLAPKSDTVVRFGTFTAEVVKVAVSACRVFS